MHVIHIHKLDFVMYGNTAIYSASNTIKLHIQSDLNSGYIHNFYHDKQEVIAQLFFQYIKLLLKDIDHPALVK